MRNKVVIGIVPDFFCHSINHSSIKDHFGIACNYVDILEQSGAVVIILPYQYSSIENYIDLIDGIIIAGGGFIDPNRYGKPDAKVKVNKERDEFEFAILQKVIDKTNMPILGICNGMQAINIIYGGSLNHHITDHEQKYHENYTDYTIAFHDIDIEKNSKLYQIIEQEHAKTNSSHMLAVDKLGQNLQISARASKDGIIEAIEHKTHPFCLGLQWHPEFQSSNIDQKIFNDFVFYCQIYKNNK
jgi:putative glutamine amidotransferase